MSRVRHWGRNWSYCRKHIFFCSLTVIGSPKHALQATACHFPFIPPHNFFSNLHPCCHSCTATCFLEWRSQNHISCLPCFFIAQLRVLRSGPQFHVPHLFLSSTPQLFQQRCNFFSTMSLPCLMSYSPSFNPLRHKSRSSCPHIGG